MITYEKRVAKLKKPDDVDEQISQARTYMMRLRQQSKSDSLSLEQKLVALEKVKAAEAVFRKLRMNSFDLEDQLRETAAA